MSQRMGRTAVNIKQQVRHVVNISCTSLSVEVTYMIGNSHNHVQVTGGIFDILFHRHNTYDFLQRSDMLQETLTKTLMPILSIKFSSSHRCLRYSTLFFFLGHTRICTNSLPFNNKLNIYTNTSTNDFLDYVIPLGVTWENPCLFDLQMQMVSNS